MKLFAKCLMYALLAVTLPTGAQAADLCNLIAVRDVSPMSGGDYVVTKGETIGAVTQYRVSSWGQETFCIHGGGCYPRLVSLNGEEEVEAVRLTNCKIGAEISRDEEGVIYSVEVDRLANSASALRFDDIENVLLDFGMCSACADNAARHYVEQPTGECATLVKSAIEGNPEAKGRLANAMPEFCAWNYE